jgi:hypothetical protein
MQLGPPKTLNFLSHAMSMQPAIAVQYPEHDLARLELSQADITIQMRVNIFVGHSVFAETQMMICESQTYVLHSRNISSEMRTIAVTSFFVWVGPAVVQIDKTRVDR